MDNETFDDYVSMGSYPATSGANTVEELCESHVGIRVLRGKKRKGKIANPNPKLC
jgi:hypothetical protein